MELQPWAVKARGWASSFWQWSKENSPDWQEVVMGIIALMVLTCVMLALVWVFAGFVTPAADGWVGMQSKRWEVERIKLDIDRRNFTKELDKLKADEEAEKNRLWLRPYETSFPPKSVIEYIPVEIKRQALDINPNAGEEKHHSNGIQVSDLPVVTP